MREGERWTEQEVGQNVKHPNKNFVIPVVYQTLYKKLLLPSILLLVGGDVMHFLACIFPLHNSFFLHMHLSFTPFSLLFFSRYVHCHKT